MAIKRMILALGRNGALGMMLFASAAAASDRVVSVALTDKDGAAVKSVSTTDLAVEENGIAREVVDLAIDTRPLSLALIVDSSEALSSAYRLNIVPAIAPFLRSLPEGSRYMLWTTGDRPTRRVEWSDDPAAATAALRRVYPQGGNTLLDGIVEVTKELAKKEAARTAVVVITGSGIDFSSRTKEQAVDESLGKADIFYVLEINEGGDVPFNLQYALANLTDKSGGMQLRLMTAMGMEFNLNKVAADLNAHYRLTYSESGDAEKRKLLVTIAQPGARARVLGAVR